MSWSSTPGRWAGPSCSTSCGGGFASTPCAGWSRGASSIPESSGCSSRWWSNRALEPLSKLAGATWVRDRVAIEGLADVDEDRCYRAMDWLLEIEEPLAEAVYWSVADLLDLEVDLLFFDTTSTYFESSGDDREVTGWCGRRW